MKLLLPVALLTSAFLGDAVRDTAQGTGQRDPGNNAGNDTWRELPQGPKAVIIPNLRVAMPLPGFTGDNCMRKGGVISALYELVCEGALGLDGELKVLAWALNKVGWLGVGSVWYAKANENTEDLQDRYGTTCSFEDFWRRTIVPSLSESSRWPSQEEQGAFYENQAQLLLQKARDMDFDVVTFYLSIPPSAFGVWASSIGKVKERSQAAEGADIRIMVEKPLGRDIQSFRQLMHTFTDTARLTDRELYLLDHYSGKEMIMSMPLLFGQNPAISVCAFQAKCDASKVRVVQLEARDVAGRDFEDIGGQVRDMVQSHLLQMLVTFVAGEGVRPRCPECLDATWSSAKLTVLQSFRVVSARLAQYEGYLDDGNGRARRGQTPTYACLQLRSSLPGWEDTLFEIETAKSVEQRIAYLEVTNRQGQAMRVSVQPEMGVLMPTEASKALAKRKGKMKMHLPGLGSMRFNNVAPKRIGTEMVMYSPEGRVPSAYAYILEAAFRGNHKLFCNMAEVDRQWILVQDFLEAPEGVTLPVYEKGTPAREVYGVALPIAAPAP